MLHNYSSTTVIEKCHNVIYEPTGLCSIFAMLTINFGTLELRETLTGFMQLDFHLSFSETGARIQLLTDYLIP